jgi:acetyl esterase
MKKTYYLILHTFSSYRLAPEYPFPAVVDDCYTVAKYVLEHGDSKKLRIDRSRVALAGDSAGMSI